MARVEKELILTLMAREGVTKAELARRLGKKRSSVTETLTANVNRSMLVSDLIEYASALGYTLELTAKREA